MGAQILRSASAVVLIVASTMIAGCLALAAGAAAGAGGVAYAKGDLTSVVAATPPRATKAAEQALSDLGMLDVVAQSTQVDGSVVARTAKDKKIAINISREGSKSSKVSIRVGVFGDEALSRSILEKIESHL